MASIGAHAFTIDVEDGISIAMRDVFGVRQPQTERVLRCTHAILDLLAQHEVKGTFFCLGQVGERFPELIKRMVKEGHEIGVHGYDHYEFTKMFPEKARSELSRAKALLEDISGMEILGHRAPAFSISPKTAWGLEVIASCGFKYDSSIIPATLGRYGWKGFPKDIALFRSTEDWELIIVPVSTISVGNQEIPFSGGSYLRLLPLNILRKAFKKNGSQRPNILYIHPYELDTQQYPEYYFEALARKPLLTRLKMRAMWWQRSKVIPKLKVLLQEYSFSTLAETIKSKNDYPVYELNFQRNRVLVHQDKAMS